MKDTKIIYDPRIARELLRHGYVIVDIKPDKYDEDGKRTLFVFRNENDLGKAVFDISQKYKVKR